MRTLFLSLSIAFLSVRYVIAQEASWKFFHFNETTEESVLLVFGHPDNVELQYSYDDFRRFRDSNQGLPSSEFLFSYTRLHGDLNILKGPLGEASSVRVSFDHGKVVLVEWEYAVKYKTQAEGRWLNDATFNTVSTGWLRIGSKKLPGGTILYVTCSCPSAISCDGPIQVTFSMDTKQE